MTPSGVASHRRLSLGADRRAVRSTFGETTKAGKLQALDGSAGSWGDRRFTVAEYVDAVRSDLTKRLSRLGLE